MTAETLYFDDVKEGDSAPELETQPFWEGCREGRFLPRHCNACGEDHF